MSNQMILWGMLIAPWLTLVFMPKEDIKRFMPVALLTALTSAIIAESGITLNLWGTAETLYPLNQMQPFSFGAIPAFTMWIFKFTYGRFWLYIVTNAIVDLVFAYLLMPWLVIRGVMSFLSSSFTVYLINFGHEMVLYGYQMWQDEAFVQSDRTSFCRTLQPIVAKPLPEDEENSPD